MTYSNYECLIEINGTGISGASISSMSQDTNLTMLKSMGLGLFGQTSEGFSTQKFSVTKPLCISGGDPLKYLTGDVSCSGCIKIGNSGLAFTSGFLTRYNVNYSLEEAPNVTLDFSIFGNSYWTPVPSASPQAGPFYFAKLGLIDLDLSGMLGITNSFGYTITVQRRPFFAFSSQYPVAVKTIDPRELSVSAKGYISDAPHFLPNLYNKSGVMDYFDFSLYTYGNTGDVLLDSQTGRVNLESSNVSISIDDEFEFDFGLKTYF